MHKHVHVDNTLAQMAVDLILNKADEVNPRVYIHNKVTYIQKVEQMW